MNAQSNLLAITHHNGIATVAINNPPVNVITSDLINAINAFVLSLKDDRDTKVVVFKSLHETFFLAHLDLNVINGTQGGQAASIEFNHMIANIKAMKQLSVALVDGVARGGGNEFVMACDLPTAPKTLHLRSQKFTSTFQPVVRVRCNLPVVWGKTKHYRHCYWATTSPHNKRSS